MSNYKFYKKFTAKGIALLLVAVLGASGATATFASSLSDAKNKKSEAQSKLDSATDQIDDIEDKQSSLQSEINETDQDLVDLLVNIGILEDELAAKNTELEQVTADLATAQDTEASQYASMKKRIQFMYERGDTAMLQALLESKDLADFLNRVEYVSGVYTYDRDLLTQYQATVQQVSDLKTSVEQEKASLEEMQSEYASQQDNLETILATKKSQMGDYDTQLANAQAAAATAKATIQEQNEVIKAEEAKAAAAAAKAAAAAAASTASSNTSASTSGNNASTTTSSGSSDSSSDSSSSSSGSSGSTVSAPSGSGGSSVVAYATQFVGNPYVWGGTSLTNGADCSGFIMSVYANFGVSLPHSSGAMQSVGTGVDYASAQPGDIICYSGHVAIYMGGGQIVHAANSVLGITTGSATYRTILAVRRVL